MTPEEIVEIMNYTRDPILDSFVDKLNVKDKEYKKNYIVWFITILIRLRLRL